jgi:predicted nucleic acid-binding protein
VIVLDTNVLSEIIRPRPTATVVEWMTAQATADLYTTSVTEAEILYGILLLPAGRRRSALESAATSMFEDDFQGRVLGFGSETAPIYARIASDRRRAGRPISHFDAQIAAIARSMGATIATRNTADFDGCGVTVLDPWTD